LHFFVFIITLVACVKPEVSEQKFLIYIPPFAQLHMTVATKVSLSLVTVWHLLSNSI